MPIRRPIKKKKTSNKRKSPKRRKTSTKRRSPTKKTRITQKTQKTQKRLSGNDCWIIPLNIGGAVSQFNWNTKLCGPYPY